jgi:DUF917 family protein
MLALKERLGLERKVEHEIVQAVKELESYVGIRIAAMAACELGGLNTPAPISAAAALGIPAVDGDYAGRAIPASVHLKISIAGKDIWPRAFCDFAGNITVIKQASSHAMMERIQKYLSMTTIGLIGNRIKHVPKNIPEKIVMGIFSLTYSYSTFRPSRRRPEYHLADHRRRRGQQFHECFCS